MFVMYSLPIFSILGLYTAGEKFAVKRYLCTTTWPHAMCYNFHKFWLKCVSLVITLPFKLHTNWSILSVFYFIETLKLFLLPRPRNFCSNARETHLTSLTTQSRIDRYEKHMAGPFHFQ